MPEKLLRHDKPINKVLSDHTPKTTQNCKQANLTSSYKCSAIHKLTHHIQVYLISSAKSVFSHIHYHESLIIHTHTSSASSKFPYISAL